MFVTEISKDGDGVWPPLLSPRPVLRDTFEPDLGGPALLLPGEKPAPAVAEPRQAAVGAATPP
jgi:hypothetical protein